VRALLEEPAPFEHEDLVGSADRRQAVGDDQARPARGEVVERGEQQLLRVGVER
jgi:hypothetical protein